MPGRRTLPATSTTTSAAGVCAPPSSVPDPPESPVDGAVGRPVTSGLAAPVAGGGAARGVGEPRTSHQQVMASPTVTSTSTTATCGAPRATRLPTLLSTETAHRTAHPAAHGTGQGHASAQGRRNE